jgi:hypothetical protein
MKKGRSRNKYFNWLILIVLICLSTNCYSQNIKQNSGTYVYKSSFYYESLELKNDGEFIYKSESELAQEVVMGNWQTRGDEIVLDSRPQKDKILVFENRSKSKEEKIFVFDKKENPINYTLVAITYKNDTITLKNQFRCSAIKERLNSFRIIDSGGITSPLYKIMGTRTNEFKVLFETSRVFENEEWDLKGLQITPKNSFGKIQNYYLQKQ